MKAMLRVRQTVSTIGRVEHQAKVIKGLGLRGPPGFFRAILASDGDDARGAALVILFILGTTAVGTAIAAPYVTAGLAPLAGVGAGVSCLSVVLLLVLHKLDA